MPTLDEQLYGVSGDDAERSRRRAQLQLELDEFEAERNAPGQLADPFSFYEPFEAYDKHVIRPVGRAAESIGGAAKNAVGAIGGGFKRGMQWLNDPENLPYFGEGERPGSPQKRVMDDAPGDPLDYEPPAPTVAPAQQYDIPPDPEPFDDGLGDFDPPSNEILDPDLTPLVPEGQFGDGEIVSPNGAQGFGGNDAPGISDAELFDLGDDDNEFLDLASGQGYARFGDGPGIAVDGDQFTTEDGQGGALPDQFGFGTAERRRAAAPGAKYASILAEAAEGNIADPDMLREAVVYQGARSQIDAMRRRGVPVSKADENLIMGKAMAELHSVRAREQAAAQERQDKIFGKKQDEAEKESAAREKAIRSELDKFHEAVVKADEDPNKAKPSFDNLLMGMAIQGYDQNEVLDMALQFPEVVLSNRSSDLIAAIKRERPEVAQEITRIFMRSNRSDDELLAELQRLSSRAN